MGQTRIGLRVLSNPAWLGGVNYILTWLKSFRLLPERERPAVYLLHVDDAGLVLAREHAELVTGIKPFSEARLLGLDMVYPATHIFEAPFGAPWAAWIPDWQCKHLPEMFDPVELARRDLHFRLLATRAPLLVLSSQMAWDDTTRIIGDSVVPRVKLPFPAIVDNRIFDVTQAELDDTLARLGVPKRFFVVCNQFWKHKNHLLVLKALARLAEPSVSCVFTGDTTDHRWPEYFREIEAFIAEHGLASSVYLLGRVRRDEQLQLMRAAVAIIQPSRFEGWSSVVEEGRAIKKRLLLSRFPVHLEQAPAGSLFFDADDEKELAGVMRDTWESSLSSPGLEMQPADSERQEEYVVECARQFLQAAACTRANFDPERHDPKAIFVDLLRQVSQRAPAAGDAVVQRILSGMRGAFKAYPDQVPPFMSLVRQRAPELAETAASVTARPRQ